MVYADIYYTISTMKSLLLLLLFPILSLAEGDKCINEHDANARALCLAIEYGNGTSCDRITNLDMKTSCVSKVRSLQRASVWTINPMNVSTVDTRGDRKYIWQR